MNSKPTLFILMALALVGCSNSITEEQFESYNVIHQTKGPDLGYSPASGVQIINIDGFAFKDLNRNGELDVYEDWRQAPEDRAKDLASAHVKVNAEVEKIQCENLFHRTDIGHRAFEE